MKLFFSEEEALDNELINTKDQGVFCSSYIFDLNKGCPGNYSDIYAIQVYYSQHKIIYKKKELNYYILNGFEEAAKEIILKALN